MLKLVAEFAPNRINEADRSGCTPLWQAACFGKEKAIRALLIAGAEVHQSDNTGRTPLSVAKVEQVKQLLHAAGGQLFYSRSRTMLR